MPAILWVQLLFLDRPLQIADRNISFLKALSKCTNPHQSENVMQLYMTHKYNLVWKCHIIIPHKVLFIKRLLLSKPWWYFDYFIHYLHRMESKRHIPCMIQKEKQLFKVGGCVFFYIGSFGDWIRKKNCTLNWARQNQIDLEEGVNEDQLSYEYLKSVLSCLCLCVFYCFYYFQLRLTSPNNNGNFEITMGSRFWEKIICSNSF